MCILHFKYCPTCAPLTCMGNLVNLDSSGSIQMCSNSVVSTSIFVFRLSKYLAMFISHFDSNKPMGTF